jgi:hypothetical protein
MDGVWRWFPEGRSRASLAIADDAVVGGADVGFNAGVVDFFHGLADGTDNGDETELGFERGDGRKIGFPKVEIGIKESCAVGVAAGLRADVTDDADVGFFIALGPAKDELLFGGKLVAREDAGAVKTEDDGFGGLGEDAAVQIAADEEDGNFFRDASAAAHNLLWQAGGQKGESGAPI